MFIYFDKSLKYFAMILRASCFALGVCVVGGQSEKTKEMIINM